VVSERSLIVGLAANFRTGAARKRNGEDRSDCHSPVDETSASATVRDPLASEFCCAL
jgi:hypothetical protein